MCVGGDGRHLEDAAGDNARGGGWAGVTGYRFHRWRRAPHSMGAYTPSLPAEISGRVVMFVMGVAMDDGVDSGA